MRFKLTRGDLFGGLTAGIVALPLALAFGVQSGLGAEAGLYGAIFLGFFAAMLGGTASQVSGPTGPMTVVTASTVAGFVALTGNPEQALAALVVTFVLAGLLQIAMGLLKIGSLIKYIPYPVISGFMSGIGVIIILVQLFPALGLPSPGSTIDVVRNIGGAIRDLNPWAVIYTVATIAVIYLFPKITKVIPSTLVALLLVTGSSLLLGHDVPLIGDIPQGFPPLQLEAFTMISPPVYLRIVEAAVTLAMLGAIDSLLTSVIADNVTKTKHDSNRELIGQGTGNAVTGIFGGIPGAGATMRTLVNIRSGGRNHTSGMIHALVLLAILLGLGRYAALIPKSVLAGILITVGIGILDYKGFRHINKVPRADAAVMIIVLLVTVFLDLLIAVGVGLVLSSILFMKKMSDITEEQTHIEDIQTSLMNGGQEGTKLPAELRNKVVVKSIDGPLFFGFASGFQRKIDELKELKYVVLRMEKVPFIDQTGLYALEEAILSLEQKNIDVLFTGLQKQPKAMMEGIRLIPDLISKKNLFSDFKQCADWLLQYKPSS
jgi:SulP family sulfate permease